MLEWIYSRVGKSPTLVTSAGGGIMGETKIRAFATGATRDVDTGKLDFEGFLNPLVIQRFGEYMNKHRIQVDGKLRTSDNWQKGMPKECYMKSGWRHFQEWWMEHRGCESREGLEDALCGVLFNVQGYLLAVLKDRKYMNYDNTNNQL